MLSEVGGPERVAARSREVGRVHAMVGVEMDWYVDAMTEHRTACSGRWPAMPATSTWWPPTSRWASG